ncbi:MAG: Yip1 family protein [Myxococcota bacterium]|nr:Yip1 family protein [Myxococcota bacterium]
MTETPTSPSPAPGSGEPRSFPERLLGALQLDATVFDEVEHDPSALPQAAGVVALAAVAGGIGTIGGGGLAGIPMGVLGALFVWLIGTGIIWAIGVRMMEHTSDYEELLRTLGFASAPQILLVLGILPIGPLRALLALGVTILALIAWVLAVRQALDVETGRAVLICILGFIGSVIVFRALSFLTCGAAF